MLNGHHSEIVNSQFSNNTHYGIKTEGHSVGNLTINNCTFSNQEYGVQISSITGSIQIENCSFYSHQKGIVILANYEHLNIHYCDFLNNSNYALDVHALEIGDVRNNYWGDPSGPYHRTDNGEGIGERVSGKLEFDPWLPYSNASRDGADEDDGDEQDDDQYTIPIVISGILSLSLLIIAFQREDLRFLLISFLTVPLYSKLNSNVILDQPSRNSIVSSIFERPGINYFALQKKLNIGTSSFVYHLTVLEREGYIRSKKEMGRRMFFPRSVAIPSDSLSTILPPSPLQEKIIEYLKEHGPKNRKEIEVELSLKRQTVAYSIKNLERKGLVISSGRGRNDPCELVEK
jgi:predicted transcriptional regulator